jgi:lysine 6-dehydrogenase
VAAVIGMGASPGLSNLLARRAADRLDRVLDCFTVWPLDGAEDPGGDGSAGAGANDEGGRPSAAVVHLMQQISGEIDVVRDGRLERARPLEPVSLDFPGRGAGVALTVGHPEPVTLHGSLQLEGRAANAMLVKKTTGTFLDGLRRDIDAGRLDLEAAARELMAPGVARSAKAAAGGMKARGPGKLPAFFALLRGSRDGRDLWVGCHATTLPRGMDGVTSIPAALGIEALLAKPPPPGVHAPETAIDAHALLAALRVCCSDRPATVDAPAPVPERPA